MMLRIVDRFSHGITARRKIFHDCNVHCCLIEHGFISCGRTTSSSHGLRYPMGISCLKIHLTGTNCFVLIISSWLTCGPDANKKFYKWFCTKNKINAFSCKATSPVVPLTFEAWHLSFGVYLDYLGNSGFSKV